VRGPRGDKHGRVEVVNNAVRIKRSVQLVEGGLCPPVRCGNAMHSGGHYVRGFAPRWGYGGLVKDREEKRGRVARAGATRSGRTD